MFKQTISKASQAAFIRYLAVVIAATGSADTGFMVSRLRDSVAPLDRTDLIIQYQRCVHRSIVDAKKLNFEPILYTS